MKNSLNIFGVIFFVLTIGFVMISCDLDPDDNHDHDITVGETAGRLTVTGLDAYNGKYIVALGEDGGRHLLAASNVTSPETITCGLISNGEVTLKVWKFVSNTELGNFNGNGVYEFSLDILSVLTAELHGDHYHAWKKADEVAEGFVRATFVNGVGEGEFIESIEITVETTTGSLTITGLEAHNGKYIVGRAGSGNNRQLAADNASYPNWNGGLISGGSVTLKVWDYDYTDPANPKWIDFNKTVDITTFRLNIIAQPPVEYHGNHYDPWDDNPFIETKTNLAISFTNGIGTYLWE